MERLRSESSVLRFRSSGRPTQHYTIEFRGKSLVRTRGKVTIQERHEVEIKLGAAYPRTMPELRWLTPIYHPNISEIGMVCLGGYGTHWVPSLNLDELCVMLWDMARYHNYDIRSPYNREAALWVANQSTFRFPLDTRPLRDLRAALGRVDHEPGPSLADRPLDTPANARPVPPAADTTPGSKAGRYADFVRRFADDLQSLVPQRARSLEPPAEPPPQPARASGEADMVILEVEHDAPARATASGPGDEILFLE
jgi:hypothetical protein